MKPPIGQSVIGKDGKATPAWRSFFVSISGASSSAYQAVLVSGTNIKTINGVSLLGSGDITVSGSGNSYTPGNW